MQPYFHSYAGSKGLYSYVNQCWVVFNPLLGGSVNPAIGFVPFIMLTSLLLALNRETYCKLYKNVKKNIKTSFYCTISCLHWHLYFTSAHAEFRSSLRINTLNSFISPLPLLFNSFLSSFNTGQRSKAARRHLIRAQVRLRRHETAGSMLKAHRP